jgi:hypothetical protein
MEEMLVLVFENEGKAYEDARRVSTSSIPREASQSTLNQ